MAKKSSLKGWTITLLGALFFFYSFFQANMMTPLHSALLKYFGASSSDLGLLSAWYFYANIIFLIPAGLLLDRFPIRVLMGINMLIAIAGAITFAFAETLFMAGVGRFLSGIMMSSGLIICLKLASIWLPLNRMALASSMIITIGMLGGIASQAPMAFLINLFGWQGAVLVAAIFGLVIGVILWFVIRDPKERSKELAENISVWTSLYLIIKQPQNWLCGFYTGLLNLPVAIFGALFGITYLMQTYSISSLVAASVTSMLFFGMIIGSPFWGWLSDFIHRRKLPMVLGAMICLIVMLILVYINNFNLMFLHIIFFIIGFTSSAQVLGYPVISESNSPEVTGTALSLASFIIMGGGYGLGLPFVGWILDKGWEGKIIDGIHFYSVAAYKSAFITIPIGIIIGIFMVFIMKETRGKSIVNNE